MSIIDTIMDFIFLLMDRCEESESHYDTRHRRDSRRLKRLQNYSSRDVTRLARRHGREMGWSRSERRERKEATERNVANELAALSRGDFQRVVKQWRTERDEA